MRDNCEPCLELYTLYSLCFMREILVNLPREECFVLQYQNVIETKIRNVRHIVSLRKYDFPSAEARALNVNTGGVDLSGFKFKS